MDEITGAVEAPQKQEQEDKPKWFEHVSLEDAKVIIRANITTAARSFIAIGYYLKHIRDKQLYLEDGHDTIWDFARTEYGISKSTASRYMTMNDRFSDGGNSPNVAELYKGFGKSQLQEMLALNDEQLEQVTPAMTVLDIRDMSRAEEAEEEIQVPGQIDISEFPEYLPAGMSVDNLELNGETLGEAEGNPSFTVTLEDMLGGMSAALPEPERKQSFTVSLADMLGGELEEEEEPLIAISQQEQQEPEPEATNLEESSCPPNSSCRRQEWGTSPEEQSVGRGECKKCWAAWKQTEKPLQSAEAREAEPESVAEETNQAGEIPHFKAGECTIDSAYGAIISSIVRAYLDNGYAGADKECEVTAFGNIYKVLRRPDITVFYREDGRTFFDVENNRLEDEYQYWHGKEEVIDAEYTEVQEPENGGLTDMQIAQEELERAKNLLDECLKDVQDENDVHIRGMKIKVAALASLVCDMDDIENPPPKQEQPELPILKNNDQRADFVDDYETWPLWIETEETGERYYRYDLEDGTSMVIKVYHSMLFDGFTDGTYESKYREGYGRHEYYLLWPGKFFKDCEANRSTLIKKLKEVQRN